MNTSIKKILLINPPWLKLFGEGSFCSPLGLCYIAAVLEKQGYAVSIYDADHTAKAQFYSPVKKTANYGNYLSTLRDINSPIWKNIGLAISEQSPDIVGVSVTTPTHSSALNISRLVKSFNADIPVVWGGAHPTILPDETIKNKDVNIVVRGEGEYTFLDLIKNFSRLDKVLGITYRQDGGIIHNPSRPLIEDLNGLPFPAKHLILQKGNYYPEWFGNIFASRGCPYSCIFCASHQIWTRRVRHRSAENVVNEIRYIKKEFKTNQFVFYDDSFTLDQNFMENICDVFIKEKLNIIWTCSTRANLINDKLIRKMKHAGCEHILIGIESGDEETLKKIKKCLTIEHIKNAVRVLKRNRMQFSGFFMIGFPWETKRHIDNTISLMKKLNPRSATFSVAAPYPKTELYDICASEGLIPQVPDWDKFFQQSPEMYLSKNLTKEETSRIIRETAKIFEEYNKNKWRKTLFKNPLYVLKRILSGKYYRLRDLWALLRYYVWNKEA